MDKKRRPRIHKPGQGFSLKERPKTYHPGNEPTNMDETKDQNTGQDREHTPDRPSDTPSERPRPFERPDRPDRPESGSAPYERRPYEQRDRPEGGGGYERRPYENRDRPEGGGYERRPYENRDRPQGGGGYERKPYENRDRPEGGGGYERKPYENRDRPQGGGSYERRPYENRDRPQGGGGGYERKPYENRDRPQGGGSYERKPYENRDRPQGGSGYERRPYDRDRPQGGGGYERKPYENRERPQGGGGYERKPYENRDRPQGGSYERRPYENRDRPQGGGYERRPYGDNADRGAGGGDRPRYGGDRPYQKREGGGYGGGQRPYNKKPFGNKRPFTKREEFYVERKPKASLPTGEGMPLNKYLAHCGISSRRKAVEFIEQGQVTVNGEVRKEPYYRIQPGDQVMCEGKPVHIQERMVYVLLNKPKGVLTTSEDDRGRATVLDIVDPHFPERIYPVGRLDRDTTGLLLITNDGDLAQKLSHPSHNIHKQYRIGLDRPLSTADYDKIVAGLELEDGPVTPNWVRFSEDHPTREVVELEITVGRNRIVRRMFEHLGYQVRKLDRFYFAGLTKKELPRGSFRELTQREIIMLKHFTGHPGAGSKRSKNRDQEGEDADPEGENGPEMKTEPSFAGETEAALKEMDIQPGTEAPLMEAESEAAQAISTREVMEVPPVKPKRTKKAVETSEATDPEQETTAETKAVAKPRASRAKAKPAPSEPASETAAPDENPEV
jgi:23S rRNA pseudouridine2605 synthase